VDYIPDCFYAGRYSYSVPFIIALIVAAVLLLAGVIVMVKGLI
jgi:hypothetical protein